MKPVIDAKEARDSIRSGMTAGDLMAQYNLSEKGLHSLVAKLVAVNALTEAEAHSFFSEPPSVSPGDGARGAYRPAVPAPRQINAYEAVRDIGSGMSNSELMKKYRLSRNGVEDLFEQLVGEGLLLPSELQFRLSGLASVVDAPATARGRQGKSGSPDTVDCAVWQCPACLRSQHRTYDECPVCGVIVAKFKPR